MDASHAESPGWNAAGLRARLAQHLPGIGVEVVASLPSTNTALLEHLRGAPGARDAGAQVRRSMESQAFGRRAADIEPWLLVAEQQTAGRGRQGRVWQSAIGASLTFSLALPYEPVDWAGLSLAVGATLADVIDPPSGQPARIGIKWPNDLWMLDPHDPDPATGRKLGGVLIETAATGARRLAVIGIGLNVRPLGGTLGEGFGSGMASVSELDADITPALLLSHLAEPLVMALRRFENEGLHAFAERFAARDLLRGHAITTTLDDVPTGIARGIAPDGALLVDTPTGQRVIRSGEVSVRPAPGAIVASGRED